MKKRDKLQTRIKAKTRSRDKEERKLYILKKDIDVNFAENQLTIKSIKEVKEDEDKEESNGILHKGISKRHFTRSFTIADDVEIKGAELKDGLLKVSLEKIIPENKKPRTIQIK